MVWLRRGARGFLEKTADGILESFRCPRALWNPDSEQGLPIRDGHVFHGYRYILCRVRTGLRSTRNGTKCCVQQRVADSFGVCHGQDFLLKNAPPVSRECLALAGACRTFH